MRVLYRKSFIRDYRKLPAEIQKLLQSRGKIFQEDPFDHRLKTHKLAGRLQEFHAFSINNIYRVVFYLDKGEVHLYWTGTHDIYE